MVLRRTIAKEDLDLFLVTDSVEESIEYLRTRCITKFELKYEQPYKPFGWLFEKGIFKTVPKL